MSGFLNDRFISLRGFLGRTVAGVTTLGAVGAFAAAKSKESDLVAYGFDRYLKTDPKVIGYEQKRVFPVPHRGARGLALDAAGHLFVAAGKHITELAPDGAQVSDILLTAEAKCVAASGKAIFVGLRDRIEIYDRQGQRKSAWEPAGPKAYFTGIALGSNDLFVADAGQRLLLRYDLSGKLLKRIGQKDKERDIPGFIVPSPFFAVALGKDSLLRATNPGRHCVEAYTAEGDLEQSWGRPGAALEHFCGCCNPINLALLPDGRVVTVEKGIPRVKVYAADGTFETVVAGSESFAQNARVCGPNDCTLGGLAAVADPQGHVYVLDFVANNLRVMERKA